MIPILTFNYKTGRRMVNFLGVKEITSEQPDGSIVCQIPRYQWN